MLVWHWFYMGEIMEENFIFKDVKQYWACQPFDYTDDTRPMPANKAAWYSKKAALCPKCKSESLIPIGF